MTSNGKGISGSPGIQHLRSDRSHVVVHTRTGAAGRHETQNNWHKTKPAPAALQGLKTTSGDVRNTAGSSRLAG